MKGAHNLATNCNDLPVGDIHKYFKTAADTTKHIVAHERKFQQVDQLQSLFLLPVTADGILKHL